MRYLSLALLLTLLSAPVIVAAPGETSGQELAPLRVTDFNPASGALTLSYQTGCEATGNTIHYGPLDQVRSYGWSGSSCDMGTDGTKSSFNPGSGSYFFVIVGTDGQEEGSYGRSRGAGTPAERPPHTGNACGLAQNLLDACQPATVGSACSSNFECGPRSSCTTAATGGGQCGCLAPFAGEYCESCAPGYVGPGCRACAPGFVGNEMQAGDAGEAPLDRTRPETFRCVPDVPGDCTGRSCGGHGSCVVAGRDAVCACDAGFTGSDCQDCAPNYERDAAGACTLGSACRDAKCGGHGDCLAAAFGDVVCQCDAGYAGADCGGPRLRIVAGSESLSLYAGESVVLTPQGGSPPYTWSLLEGPGRIDECPPRDSDPDCPTNSVGVTALTALTDGLMIIRVGVTDGAGPQTAINLAAAPTSFVPFTGPIYTELVPFYNAMQRFMRARGVRGAVLGISKGGVVVGTNGYGYRDAGLDADPFVNTGAGEAGPLVQPNAPFRIASVTKPMTAAAVRDAADGAGVDITSDAAGDRVTKWVEDSLGFDLESDTPPYNYNVQGGGTDSRWSDVTIQHLLNHHIGFWRDTNLAAINNGPAYNSNLLPFTSGPQPNGLQIAVTGFSTDMSYATSHMLAGMQLTSDPRVTVENTILFAAGNRFQYQPGGPGFNQNQNDNYQNLGFMLAGRVLEGLKGVTYDPDDPSAPEGWGKFPTLLQDYLCESSGIQTGIWPGDAFNPRAGEPYYRDIDANGNEVRDWNMAQGDKIRFNNGVGQWEFCQDDCDLQNPDWGTTANTPSAYGGIWLAQRNSSGGLVATTSSLLRFARNHRVKVGTPGDDNDSGIGSLLEAPGNYESSSSHNGANAGTSSLLWQMGGPRPNQLPQPVGAWNSDPSAALNLAPNGNVIINEALSLASNCNLPSDVAVAVMFNQRQDRRAPVLLNTPTPNNNNQPPGNSTNGTVYSRIVDFLGHAACQVNAQGWPQLAEPPAQINFLPDCD